VLLFLARFLAAANRSAVLRRLHDLVSGIAALVDREQRPLFRNAFDYLATLGMSSEDLYADVLHLLFNANAAGTLRVNWLRRSEGELALQVGEGAPFGVINIEKPSSNLERTRKFNGYC
jgi:hypothetical protein